MKLALVTNAPASEPNFEVRDKVAYLYGTDTPYILPGSMVPLVRNIWNVLFALPGTHSYINLSKSNVQDSSVDVVLAVNEYESYEEFFRKLVQNFPNAIMVGYVKEQHPLYTANWGYGLEFLKKCPKVALPYRSATRNYVSNCIGKHVYELPYPYNIHGIRDVHRKTRKEHLIVAGGNTNRDGGESKKVAHWLAERVGASVICPNDISWEEWLKLLARAHACVNCDPSPKLGQVPIECAILRTAHLGSNLDAAHELWPLTAMLTKEQMLERYPSLYHSISDARLLVDRRHSYENFEHKLKEILRG